jgi:nitrite reductase/ring-hydroxylating ferredoxin subunit
MNKLVALVMLALFSLSFLVLSPCSGQIAAANNVTSRQVTIKGQINGDSVSIPLSEVEKNINTRFLVNTAKGQMSFMAYEYNNQTMVRADICPPCGSQSFTLTNGTLVCDSCGTVFDAKTGAGIRGACVKFNKQSVQYQNIDGNLVMSGSDLMTAYQNTLNPK